MNEEIVGTDVGYNWFLDAESDLSLVSGSDNLTQAIYLRLTSYLNNLNWCYENYGSTTKDWIGRTQNPYTRETLLSEITKRIIQDPRISEVTVEIVDWDVSYIGIKINAKVDQNKTYEEYFIFSNMVRKNDDVYNPMYKNTYIDTRKQGYYAKQGELLTVHAHVFDEDGKRVPVGEVRLSIGGYIIGDNNPQEISQSGSEEPASVTFTFRIPYFINLGEHELIFRYKGIYGYNSCVGTTKIHIVDKLPTRTSFIYPISDRKYFFANDHDFFTDSSTYTEDFNKVPARLGAVEFYIDEGELNGSQIYVDDPTIYLDDILLEEQVILYCSEHLEEYSLKFIFDLSPRLFKMFDVIELRGPNQEHLDELVCVYENGVHYLITTQVTERTKIKYKYGYNCNIKLDVLE